MTLRNIRQWGNYAFKAEKAIHAISSAQDDSDSAHIFDWVGMDFDYLHIKGYMLNVKSYRILGIFVDQTGLKTVALANLLEVISEFKLFLDVMSELFVVERNVVFVFFLTWECFIRYMLFSKLTVILFVFFLKF